MTNNSRNSALSSILALLCCIAIEFIYYGLFFGRFDLLLSIAYWIPLILLSAVSVALFIRVIRLGDIKYRILGIFIVLFNVAVIFSMYRVCVTIIDIGKR
jgi:hypothetical protein